MVVNVNMQHWYGTAMLDFLMWLSVCFALMNCQEDCARMSTACGNNPAELIATSKPQRLCSPNYPSFYPNNIQCRWRIETPKEYEVIRFKIIESHIVTSGTCGHDYVEVKDGRNTWDRTMRTWCGNSFDKGDITSSEPGMLVTFRADGSVQDKGFLLEYWAVPKDITQFAETQYNFVNYLLFAVFGVLVSSIGLTAVVIALVRTTSNHKTTSPKYVEPLNLKKLTTRFRKPGTPASDTGNATPSGVDISTPV